jgi:hypothetical protein
VVSITPRPRFTPGERAPGTHWTGGWVGPRGGLDAEVRGKILCPCPGPNPVRLLSSQTLYPQTITGECAYGNGKFVAKGFGKFKLVTNATSGKWSGQAAGLCDYGWEGRLTLAEHLRNWERSDLPLFYYTLANFLQINRSTLILSSWVVACNSLRRYGHHFRDSLGWPAENEATSVTRAWLRPALGQHKCLPVCRTKGFPTSPVFECSNMVGEQWNPQINVNLPVSYVPKRVSRNAKTHGL